MNPTNTTSSNQPPTGNFEPLFSKLRGEIQKQVVGQDYLVERLIVALIANGHVLLEGVPGLAKTRLLTTVTKAIDAEMSRVQFTPDLLPADLIGTEVYRPQTGEFITRRGPIFTNLLLADEINRAPAKVQSALLQAMQEREVTIGEQTFSLPEPFLVLATQNPIEQEGTYQLPEAQVDRFLMKIVVNYPSFDEEVEILQLVERQSMQHDPIQVVFPIRSLEEARRASHQIFSDPKIDQYIVRLVQASREPVEHGLAELIDWGASPRASLALKDCARSLAFLRGKDHVSPDEVKEVALDVLRHRILPSFEAEARGVTSDDIVRTILSSVDVP